jgi:hypothetical protein
MVSSGSVSLLDSPDTWALMMQWVNDAIDFPTLTCSMEKFGDQYIYAEWQDIMLHVFTLSEENDGRVATAVKATMDARGIILSGVNPSPELSTSQVIDVVNPQSDSLNRCVKRNAPCDGGLACGSGHTSLQRPSKRARHAVCVIAFILCAMTQ